MAHAALCGTVTIRLEGTITPEAAVKAFTRAAELACDQVVVDVSRAHDVSEVALAFLAGGLVALRPSRVSLVGVPPSRQHVLTEVGAGALLRHAYSA